MPFPVPDKANKTPITTVLKWYLERKKGKVVESRQEIRRRFDGQDWRLQKKIILAFLSSGKADRQWAYEQLIWFWDNDFLPKVKELFEKYHENGCFWAITWYFPTEYILDHADKLSEGNNYYRLCYRLASEHVDFQPDRNKLSPKEYLYIMERLGKKPEDEVASDILFEVLYDLSTNRFSKFDGVSPRHTVEKGIPLVASDFVYIYVLTRKLYELDCSNSLEQFYEWQSQLYSVIRKSPDWISLNAKETNEYSEKRKVITKRYIYELLPDKYKSPTDETPFASKSTLFEKLKEKNPTFSNLADKLGLVISDY